MEDQELSNFIYATYSAALVFVRNQLNDNIFVISKNSRLRSSIDDFKISTGEFPDVIGKCRTMHQINTIYEKNGKALEIVTNHIKQTKDYNLIQNSLDDFSKGIIDKLCEYISFQVLCQNNPTKIFIDHISRATNKTLRDGKITHISKFYVLGLYIKAEQVGMYLGADILRVKSPTPESVAEFEDAFEVGNDFHSIIEIETISNDAHIKFNDFFHKYLLPISLYNIMDVDFVAQLTHSYFKSHFGLFSHGYKGAKYPNHKFVIKDTDDFCNKVTLFYTKLVDQNIYNPSENESKAYSIHIALDRYKNATTIDKNEIDRKITEIIMGLEALYLSDEKETLGFKLKYRITQVFVQLETSYESLLTITGVAYNIRSSFAHGSAKSTSLKKSLKKVSERYGDIIPILLNILRESLLIFLFLDIEKKLFIELLNSSFVSVEKREELKGLIFSTRLKYSYPSTFIIRTYLT